MSRRFFTLFSLLALAGCSVDQQPPEQYLCSSEKPDCPAGQQCDPVLGRCIGAVDSSVMTQDARADGFRSDQDSASSDATADQGDGQPLDSTLQDTTLPQDQTPGDGSQSPDQQQLKDLSVPLDTQSPDTTAPPVCSDGIKNGSEACDGDDFGSITCESLGFDEGELSCTDQCTIVATACRNCTDLTPPAGVTPTRIVDPNNGNNNTAFEDCLPYRTITAALQGTSSGDVVWVAPGTYDAAHGESFPLAIPNGVTLVGNEATSGGGSGTQTYINGSHAAATIGCAPAVLFNNTSGRISGFTIFAPFNSTYGCAIGGINTAATISRNTLMGDYYQVKLLNNSGSATAQIRNNTLSGSTNYGVYLTGASPVIRNNYFYEHNYSAVSVYTYSKTPSIPDLGTSASDEGGNTFVAGRAIDVHSTVTIYALGNNWPNHQDPTCDSFGVIDVSQVTGAKVYWGYLAGQSCPP